MQQIDHIHLLHCVTHSPTFPYILSMTGGLIAMVAALLRPLFMWLQEQLFLLAIMKRIFFYNGEDLNSLNPPERRMLRRVMKLKTKKEAANSSFTGEMHIEDSVPDISHLESITDLSSNQAGSILSQYQQRYSRPQTADLSRDGLRDLIILKLSELQRMTFKLRDQICRIYCCCRKLRKIDLKREMLYLDGVQKIYQSLDIQNILEVVRKVNLIEKIVLSDHQRTLLAISNGNLLDMNPVKPKQKPEILESTFINDENKDKIEQSVDDLIDSAASIGASQSIDGELIKEITEYNIVNFKGEDSKAQGHRRGNTAGSDGNVNINAGATPELRRGSIGLDQLGGGFYGNNQNDILKIQKSQHLRRCVQSQQLKCILAKRYLQFQRQQQQQLGRQQERNILMTHTVTQISAFTYSLLYGETFESEDSVDLKNEEINRLKNDLQSSSQHDYVMNGEELHKFNRIQASLRSIERSKMAFERQNEEIQTHALITD